MVDRRNVDQLLEELQDYILLKIGQGAESLEEVVFEADVVECEQLIYY